MCRKLTSRRLQCTSFTFTLADHLRSVSTRPTVIFPEPRQMELNGAGFQQSPCCGVSTTALYCSLIYAHRVPCDSTTNSVGLESPSSIERMQNPSRSLPYNVPHARQCKSLQTRPTRSESQGGSARIGRMLRLLQLDRRKRVPKSTNGNGENG